jgi:hypothetical protein
MFFQIVFIPYVLLLWFLSPLSETELWRTPNFLERLGSSKLSFKHVDGGSKESHPELLTLFFNSYGNPRDLRGDSLLEDSSGVRPLESALDKVFQGFAQRQVRLCIYLEDEEHTPVWVLLRFLADAKASADPNKEITVFIVSRPKWVLNPLSSP